ncbi:MAG: PKD domain-containing protein, partial [Bacteroidia bacterium]
SGINAGNISGIFCHKNSDTLLLVLSNYGVKNIYLSTNGGTSFSAKDGNLPDMPVWSALMNPKHPEQAMIATELGIYTCSDIFAASPVWTAQQSGMGAVRTMNLRLRSSDYTVMAATHGRGVFTNDAWRYDSPLAKFSASDTQICSGKSITISDLSLNNPSTYSYSISPNKGFRFLSGTNSSSPEPVIAFDSAGSYQIRLDVSNAAGEDSFLLASKIHVEWQDSLHGNLLSSLSPLCISSAVSLSMETKGNKSGSTLTYQWSDNGNAMSGEKGSVLSINMALRGHVYRCIVSSNKTSCISQSAYSDSLDFSKEVKGLDNLGIRLSWDTLYAAPLRGPGIYSWYCNGALVG